MALAQIWGALRRFRLRSRRLLSCLGACIIVAGCAATAANPDAITAAPETGRAVIIGWGGSASENARAALTPAQGTRVSMLVVSRANNQKLSFGENVAHLPPGEYDLTISCGLYIDYRYFPHDTVVHAALDAGSVYRLRAAPVGRKCQPFLEDVTGKGG
jgi:hypothetical protein